jgi:hypothetical protein
MNQEEQELRDSVRSSLDAGLDTLDPAITGRLRESRRLAVDLSEKRSFSLFTLPRLLPASGYAALAVISVVVSLWVFQRHQVVPTKMAEEMEVLTVPGNLDMYKDLEFFQWLAQTHETR